MYVSRSHHLWKQPELLPWLERCAHAALARKGSPRALEAAEQRKTRYQGAPRNVYRHVIMSEMKDASASLPRVSALGGRVGRLHRAGDPVNVQMRPKFHK